MWGKEWPSMLLVTMVTCDKSMKLWGKTAQSAFSINNPFYWKRYLFGLDLNSAQAIYAKGVEARWPIELSRRKWIMNKRLVTHRLQQGLHLVELFLTHPGLCLHFTYDPLESLHPAKRREGQRSRRTSDQHTLLFREAHAISKFFTHSVLERNKRFRWYPCCMKAMMSFFVKWI